MNDGFTRLLCVVVGPPNVDATAVATRQGMTAVPLVSPASRDEVAECLAVAASEGWATIAAGAMGWLDCGNPVARADVVLSLRRMKRIVYYSPPDLTLVAEAGVTLGQLKAETQVHRQWLPLDSPGGNRVTVGALAACNSSGTLRLGFGSPRDYVIGLRLAHADGRSSKSGGRVVKNVAGYDMNKLYVGSYGTLALLTEVTFKLRPLYERDATVQLSAVDPGTPFQAAQRVLESRDLLPASLFYIRGLVDHPNEAVGVRFVESRSVVMHQVERIKSLMGDLPGQAAISGITNIDIIEEAGSERYWEMVGGFDSESLITARLSVPPARVFEAASRCIGLAPDATLAADLGVGIVRFGTTSDGATGIRLLEQLRGAARQLDGTLFIERAPLELKQAMDSWGEVRSGAEVMRGIKRELDPAGLLSPGRFAAGI
jgi:glycolate oxidase FAD binding subunit